MSNILSAIQAIVSNSSIDSDTTSMSRVQNRANQMGELLEDYVKNAFADCIGKSTDEQNKARSNTFSYLGNSNNPPDAMLQGGDAIEIKKLESIGTSQLQLNSSFPKNKLHSNNSKICAACRDCEEWDEKDMIYAVGHVDKQHRLHNLLFVYGDLYCDAPEIYENVEKKIKEGIQSIEGVEFAETDELGRVNRIDHLGISDLRVRGMWLIKSPFLQFKDLIDKIPESSFKLIALIPEEKYSQFNNVKEFEDFCKENSVSISDEFIPNPQNPAKLIKSKIITSHK